MPIYSPPGLGGEPGPVTMADLPAGSVVAVKFDGTDWPDRPTDRTDLFVYWMDYTGTAPAPPTGIPDHDVVVRDVGGTG